MSRPAIEMEFSIFKENGKIEFTDIVIFNMSIIIICTVYAASVFLYEHIGRQYNVSYRPSIMLNYIKDLSRNVWRRVGFAFAEFSRYVMSPFKLTYKILKKIVTIMHFEDVPRTFIDILIPLYKLGVSPFYMCKGYHDYIKANVRRQHYVIAGTLFIAIMTSSLSFVFRQNIYNGINVTRRYLKL